MEMIDRYVYEVTNRLPEGTREDVARELRANIEDMLPEDAVEKDVRAVLEKLGNPAALANEYRQVKRYLIGPALYDSYISTLKLVIGIAVIVFTFLALLGALSKSSDSDVLFKFPGGLVSDMTDLVSNLIIAALEGAVQAFLWVTVVFAILELTGVSEGHLPFKIKKWSVDDLQTVPASAKGSISWGESVLSLVFTVIFTSIFLFRPELIGWYGSGDEGLKLIAPVFDITRLQAYIPSMVILAILQFGISIYKLVSRRWTIPLAAVNTINNLGLSILVYLMLNDRSLFNSGFITHLAGLLDKSVDKVNTSISNGVSVFIIIFIIGCAIDSINGFVKCRKIPGITIIKAK